MVKDIVKAFVKAYKEYKLLSLEVKKNKIDTVINSLNKRKVVIQNEYEKLLLTK